MKRETSAQLVWDALADAQEEGKPGLTKAQIARATGLGFSQITYALGYIDDVLQLREGRPRAYHPYRKLYTLSETWAEHQPYKNVRFKSIMSQLRRYESNLTAAAMAFTAPDDQGEIHQELGSLRGIISQIEHSLMNTRPRSRAGS